MIFFIYVLLDAFYYFLLLGPPGFFWGSGEKGYLFSGAGEHW